MKRTRINHFGICPNEFMYNRETCMYQTVKYIHELEITDKISTEVSNYIFHVNVCIYNGALVFYVPVKPKNIINIKVTIN